MDIKQRIVGYSTNRYKTVTALMIVFTMVLGSLIPLIKVDTDPENMLAEDEPVRLFHNKVKERFVLNDIVVVGIVNDRHPDGVFNPESLSRIHELTEFAATELIWPSEEDPNKTVGVIEVDLLAPSKVDYIGQGGPGVIKFEWLMKTPPQTQDEALQIRDKAMSNPLLKGTVVSEDGKAICLYLPLTSKDLSYTVYTKLNEKIATFKGAEQYHITGLPVAEDTFGYEMFIQMAISAPLAMLVIFILMLLFFRKLVLIISPMIVALVSVISTMGLLIGLGYPVHIMSSMIPIFLMPIAVVDSVHILSEFFDLYTQNKGTKNTIREVMDNLFTPMLYTSLTSAAGFASLALTPIPPVQVFGVFVAIGIMIAWLCTVIFVPAYVMMIPTRLRRVKDFGYQGSHSEKKTWLGALLDPGGRFTYNRSKSIITVVLILTAIAIYGITLININDNPVKWFAEGHPIRAADEVLNDHFGGTYMAYLVLDDASGNKADTEFIDGLRERLQEKASELNGQSHQRSRELPKAPEVISKMDKLLLDSFATGKESTDMMKSEFLDKLLNIAGEKEQMASEAAEADVWYELQGFFEMEKQRLKIFKRPEVLRYTSKLEDRLAETGLVGKSNSISDIVKKVHQELIDGRKENYIIPDSSRAVAECLIQFQNSHTPDDLWHFVRQDYRSVNVWLQLKSGDNKDMTKVSRVVREFFEENNPPIPMEYKWAGLTYINVVWQHKMVWGMLQSFLGSFLVVFIMMSILFRSIRWGLVCMIPLTITIVLIYGLIGLMGKDYDMPVAVLSALTLGMAVDFAIHFLQRARVSLRKTGSWKESSQVMFGEPARAISRNVLVIAIGFLPLLAAPLVPYKTVGIFMFAIMALSGTVTLLVLPAILRLAENKLFKPLVSPVSPTCNCGFCLVVSAAVVILIAVNLHQYWNLGWSVLTWFSIVVIPLVALVCGISSRRRVCKMLEEKKKYED